MVIYKQEAFEFWGSQLPKRVKMKVDVYPDMLFFVKDKSICCLKGEVYDVEISQHGAVSVIFGVDRLGLKPKEFEVVEWFRPGYEVSQ